MPRSGEEHIPVQDIGDGSRTVNTLRRRDLQAVQAARRRGDHQSGRGTGHAQ